MELSEEEKAVIYLALLYSQSTLTSAMDQNPTPEDNQELQAILTIHQGLILRIEEDLKEDGSISRPKWAQP